MMMSDVQSKVALVTGGSRGIGKAIVLELAQAGYDVAFTYRSNQTAAEAVATEASAFGVKVKAYPSDVSDSAQANSCLETVVKDFGRLDALVNNAGITKDTLLIRMSDADWDAVLQTNLNGVFYTTRAAAKVMMKQRTGAIINISSVVGVFGNAGQANYAASKSALIGFSKSVAKELGSRGVTCNVIAPGFIETEMTDHLPNVEMLLQAISLKRMGQPLEIAKTVRFFAESTYITGQVLGVDGGMAF
jgi:3-oxoacyl-[acyl-carrier protein] reductase